MYAYYSILCCCFDFNYDITILQLDGELLLAPGFACPPNLDYSGYHSYIDENLPPESPNLYGLHPNAEIGFLTTTSENLFRTVLEMQPRDSSGAGASGTTREEKVRPNGHNVLMFQMRLTCMYNYPYSHYLSFPPSLSLSLLSLSLSLSYRSSKH